MVDQPVPLQGTVRDRHKCPETLAQSGHPQAAALNWANAPQTRIQVYSTRPGKAVPEGARSDPGRLPAGRATNSLHQQGIVDSSTRIAIAARALHYI